MLPDEALHFQSSSGGTAGREAFDTDIGKLVNSALLVQSPRSADGDPDFRGRAMIAGEQYAIRGSWRAGSDGPLILELRFIKLQAPPRGPVSD